MYSSDFDEITVLTAAVWPLAYRHILLLLLTPLAFIVYQLVYNRYFHPLSHFPGPICGGLSDFYHTYLFSTKEYHLHMLELHRQYGSIVRIGPNQLSFDDPKLIPLVYNREAEKTPFYSTGLAGEVAPLLQIQGHREHAAKLKTLSATYSMKNLKLMEASIDQRILETVEALRTRFVQPGLRPDLAQWIRFYVYDAITTLLYGEPVGMVREGCDTEDLIVSWHDMFTLGGLVATLPWLFHTAITTWPLKDFWMPRKGHKGGSGHIMDVHERLFRERLSHPQRAVPGNLFDSFCANKRVDGTPCSLEDAERECFLLTVASQDTTAGFISPLLHNITANQRVYELVMREIEALEVQGALSHPVCSYEETTNMPYFMACCKETLRLQPPTPIILPRFVPPGGIVYNSVVLPAGAEVGANPHVIQRCEEIFGPDACAFVPERWLRDPVAVRLMDKYMLSWGYGSRKCVGKNIALFDSQKLAVQLLREFRLTPRTERPWRTANWGINMFWDQFVTLEERHARA